MNKRLERAFFENDDVIQISRDLLGKFLVTNIGGLITSGMIVETEAYKAPEDKACHAYGNKWTNRTKIMFGKPGTAYIYLCYGIHHLFNVVTAAEGRAHAVLIRAVKPIDNVQLMMNRRGMDTLKPQLTAGPGALTKALGIEKKYNGIDLFKTGSPIYLEDRSVSISKKDISETKRIGVDYAEECAEWPWRFIIKDCTWVSKIRKKR